MWRIVGSCGLAGQMLNSDEIERFGIVRVLIAAILWRLQRYFGINIWAISSRRLSANAMTPEHARRFEFRLLTLEDALEASQNPALELPSNFIRAAFQRNDVCFGAYENENLVAYAWRSLTCAPVTNGLWVRVDSQHHLYGYKALVLPEYRGMRLNTSLRRFSDPYFIKSGIKKSMIGSIDLYNFSSQAAHGRDSDRKRLGFAGFISVRGRYLTFRTKGVRGTMSFEKRPA